MRSRPETQKKIVYNRQRGVVWRPAFSPSGHIVFQSFESLWAVPFALETLQTNGEAFLLYSEGMDPSVAADGSVLFRPLNSMPLLSFASLDRTGKVGQDASKVGVPGSRIAYYEKLTGHNVPEAIWTFLNASGPVEVAGKTVQQSVMDAGEVAPAQ